MFTVAFSHGKITSNFYFPLLLLYVVSIFFLHCAHLFCIYIYKKKSMYFHLGKMKVKKKKSSP